MNSDPTSLDNLHDVVSPEPLSYWWPLASGMQFLAWMTAIALLYLGWCCYRNWLANAYRRAALDELGKDPQQLPAILKRVAIVSYGRETVASLSGDRWLAFLNEKVRDCFDADACKQLLAASYGNESVEAELQAAAIRWIRRHPRGQS